MKKEITCFEAPKIMEKALDVGEAMLCTGAEISRVEDTILRICHTYGGGTPSLRFPPKKMAKALAPSIYPIMRDTEIRRLSPCMISSTLCSISSQDGLLAQIYLDSAFSSSILPRSVE